MLECTAYMQDNCFVFYAKWKHIVTGGFLRNEITAMYNLLLFYDALKIYKLTCFEDYKILLKHHKELYVF